MDDTHQEGSPATFEAREAGASDPHVMLLASRLDSLADSLWERVERLEKKLEPILTPPGQEVRDVPIREGEDKALATSELATGLAGTARQLEVVAANLVALTLRAEV